MVGNMKQQSWFNAIQANKCQRLACTESCNHVGAELFKFLNGIGVCS